MRSVATMLRLEPMSFTLMRYAAVLPALTLQSLMYGSNVALGLVVK